MSFLNKILRKDKVEGAKKERNGPALRDGDKETVREEAIRIIPKGKFPLGILLRPQVTEKSTNSGEENKYMFVVSRSSNKIRIAEAVGKRYGVDVLGVNILNMPGKVRRRGKQMGWKSGFKKAVVTLKEGQSIEIQ